VDWDVDKGWHAPRIIPYGPMPIDPAASGLHYGLQCFEGMKAYLDDQNRILLFRPMKNMERMNVSMKRLFLPAFDGAQFLECMKELIRLDRDWIPKGMGYSLYLRPTAVSTYAYIGVGPSKATKLYCICSPVGPYYPTGFNPVKLLAEPKYVRAWPGGTGFTKCGGNYAMTIQPAQEAMAKGYQQVLWLFGNDHQVTEVGTMNIFFFWQTPQGKKELITAPLDGTILAGVTRDSILALTRQWNEFTVSERKFTIHDLIKAQQEGRLIEAFGAGTAAIVSPVNLFHFDGKDYPVPLDKNDKSKKAGPLAQRIMDTIMAIQYGKKAHEWSMVI